MLKDLLGRSNINFYTRIENDEKKGKDNIQWIDYITKIMLTYNTKDVHSATGLTPKEASKPKNEVKAKISMTIRARKPRMYPEIKVGDQVKIMRKKAITEKHFSLAEKRIFYCRED